MGQVPHYLIIGNGRVARHFAHYFSELGIAYSVWHRHQSIETLSLLLQQSSHVLVLIKDDVIEAFINHYLNSYQGYIIHFSGSLVSELAYGAHPLSTFNDALYSRDVYERIPFFVDHDAPVFAELLPGLPNPHVILNKSQKEKYHALCVMAGNFTCMLWQKLFASFESELNIPNEMAHPYLQQQVHNLIHFPADALTGPLVRRDQKTIEKHLAALSEDPFQKIYESFVECYQQMKRGEPV